MCLVDNDILRNNIYFSQSTSNEIAVVVEVRWQRFDYQQRWFDEHRRRFGEHRWRFGGGGATIDDGGPTNNGGDPVASSGSCGGGTSNDNNG